MNEEELGRQFLELGRLLAPLRILLQGQVPQRYLYQGTRFYYFTLPLHRQQTEKRERERALVFLY
jgi:hypothetical protein